MDRVAGAALFGWIRSRFFGPAPAPTPTPTLTHRTVNILFLRDPKYDYESMTTMTATATVTVTVTVTVTDRDRDRDGRDRDRSRSRSRSRNLSGARAGNFKNGRLRQPCYFGYFRIFFLFRRDIRNFMKFHGVHLTTESYFAVYITPQSQTP